MAEVMTSVEQAQARQQAAWEESRPRRDRERAIELAIQAGARQTRVTHVAHVINHFIQTGEVATSTPDVAPHPAEGA